MVSQLSIEIIITALIHILVMLTILQCLFTFVVLPTSKDLWNETISTYDDIIKEEIPKIMDKSNYNENFYTDEYVKQRNTRVQNEATKISLVVFIITVVFISTLLIFSKCNIKILAINTVSSLFVIFLTYTLFTLLFIRNYDPLNITQAVKHLLVTVYNTLYPNEQIPNIYYQ